MPKIIDDAEQMILASAKKILLEGNYHNFSMRNVAKDCSIGVGTIYNYYASKMVLIASVMSMDWEKAKVMMDDSCENAKDVTEGLIGIYDAIKGFSAIYFSVWNQFAQGNETTGIIQRYHPMLQEQINQKIEGLLERFGFEEDKKIVPILSEAILSASTKSQISVEQVRILGDRLFHK